MGGKGTFLESATPYHKKVGPQCSPKSYYNHKWTFKNYITLFSIHSRPPTKLLVISVVPKLGQLHDKLKTSLNIFCKLGRWSRNRVTNVIRQDDMTLKSGTYYDPAPDICLLRTSGLSREQRDLRRLKLAQR